MSGKKRATPIEEFSAAVDNVRVSLQLLGISPIEKQRLTARIDRLEIDTKKVYHTEGTPQQVVIIDRLSGEMKSVEGYKAQLAQWRAKDKDSYNAFEEVVKNFMASFSDNSLFVKLFGRNAEGILPPAEEVHEDEIQ